MRTARADANQVRRDYSLLASSGAKLITDAQPHVPTEDFAAALERLIALRLASQEGEAFTLQRPAYALVSLDPETTEELNTLYDVWLRSDPRFDGDEILYGELGFWQHWWNMLEASIHADQGPLIMDVVVLDQQAFSTRAWSREFDSSVVDYALANSRMTGRVIVPPSVLEAPAEGLVEMALAGTFEVRVLPSPTSFALYDSRVAVLPEPSEHHERHRLTRAQSVVEPLVRLFSLQWSLALPWDAYTKGTADILPLLAQGWTDARIAAALGVSERTVSRRVSDAMDAAGVQSRFALGVNYALSGMGDAKRTHRLPMA